MQAAIENYELTYRRRPIIFQGDPPLYPSDIEGIWYVAECEDTADKPRSGPRRWYEFSRTPHKTNMSHQARTSGWLGSSFDVDRHAIGAVRCTLRDGRASFRAVPL